MDSVKNIRVGEEGAKAGFSAQIDCPAAIPGAREIGGIGIVKDPSAEGDEALVFLCLCRMLCHFKNRSFQLARRRIDNPPYGLISAMKTSNGLTVNP